MLQERAEQIARFKHLTETVLPRLAHEGHWPIHFDHCFKRICLDHAFGDVWYNHLPRPAERHIDGEPLARAILCGEEILAHGLPVLEKHNEASLKWRGKAKPNRRA